MKQHEKMHHNFQLHKKVKIATWIHKKNEVHILKNAAEKFLTKTSEQCREWEPYIKSVFDWVEPGSANQEAKQRKRQPSHIKI